MLSKSVQRVLFGSVLLVVVVAAAWFFLLRQPLPDAAFPGIGSRAEDFSLEELVSGKTVKLSDFKSNRAVFLNFWASWCPFCAQEMPDMATIQREFEKDIVILAINRAEFGSVAEQFAKDIGAHGTYPLLLDQEDRVFKLYGGFAMPTSFFIDKRGIIRSTAFGPLTLEEMRNRIRETLNPLSL